MSNSKYKGAIIKESLQDTSILDNLEVTEIEVTDDTNPDDRWNIYSVLVDRAEIDQFKSKIKQGWYMHFWQDNDVIVIFKDKRFEFNFDDKESWKPAVEYGLSLGIPKDQLDFIID